MTARQGVSPVLDTPDVPTIDFVIAAEDMAQFRALSGDTNPIHSDAGFAAARGFEGPVVYGGLLVAVISRLLGNELPGPGCIWHRLDLRFRKALYVGETARLTAEVTFADMALGVIRMTVRIEAGGRLIADGTVQAGLARADLP